jgi:cytochrome c biogenesis protein CcdA
VLVLGSVYVGAVFLTYLAAGAGLLGTGLWFTRGHLPSRLAALASVVLGLWMLKDALLPSAGPRLEASHGLRARAQAVARRARVPALILGGFLIGLCSIPCSGAVYVAIVALLAAQPNPLAAYGYLVLYNVMFIVPLWAILAMGSSRGALAQLSGWQREHREGGDAWPSAPG